MQDHLRRQYAMAYLVIHAAFNPRLQGLSFVPRLACLFGRLGRLDIYTPHPVMVNVCIQIRACVDPLLCCKVLWRGFAPHSMLHARDLFLLSADPRCLASSYKAQNMLLIAPIAYKVDRKTCVHRIFFHTTAKDARIEYGTCE